MRRDSWLFCQAATICHNDIPRQSPLGKENRYVLPNPANSIKLNYTDKMPCSWFTMYQANFPERAVMAFALTVACSC
jgi:hypothetical protein